MKEIRKSGKTVYDGKIIKVVLDEVILPDGKTSFREIVRHSGGACVLAIDEGKVVLVSQYRYAYGENLWELPAGKIEKGEEPESAARRELEEEAGLRAETLEKIASIKPSPGYTDEIIHIFFAPKVESVRQRLDEGEFLSVGKFTPEEAFEMRDRGEISDAKTLVALDYLKERLMSE